MPITADLPKGPKSFTPPSAQKPINYRYLATNSQGEKVKGTVKAVSEIAAERLIIAKGHTPEHVEVVPSMFSLEEALPSIFKVKLRDVTVFSRQLATLLKSGISLLPSLEILRGQVGMGRVFNNVLGSIVNDIRSGGSFSESVSKYPKAFSEIYSRTIAMGEESGNLETVLNRMADFMEKQSMMSQKIGKALTYPILVLVVGLVVLVVLITFVMPQLLSLFTSVKLTLPLPTRILIAVTELFTVHKLQLLIGAILLTVAVLWAVKQPTGRRLLDHMRLVLPVIGPPAIMSELGRLTRTMSVLVGAGLKLQDILEILPKSTTNTYIQSALRRVQEALLLGEGLSEPMSRENILPPLLVQMVAVGEESNTLEFTMGVIADFYETSAEERTDAMVGMIGPLSTISIALLVGFIAVSVLMPMYTITGAFG